MRLVISALILITLTLVVVSTPSWALSALKWTFPMWIGALWLTIKALDASERDF